MNTVTSKIRLASLTLAVSMVASIISASAVKNTQIYINDELAVDGAAYSESAIVTVKGDDVNVVTVNGEKAELDENNSFEIVPVEEPTSQETIDEPVTPVTPAETTDEPASADNSAPKTPAGSGAALNSIEVVYGDVVIAVYNSKNELTSSVSVVFSEDTEPMIPPVTTPDTPVTTPDTPVTTPDTPVTTPDTPVTTPDTPVTTPDTPIDIEPVATPDTPVTTPDTPVTTPDTPVTTPDTPVTTPDTPIATPDTPITTPDTPDPVVVYATGDVDNDGYITAADALMALRASARFVTLNDAQTAAADVDKDGYITSGDALKILRVSIKLDTFAA